MSTTPQPLRISLNSDIGEGYGVYAVADDAALLDLVSDVNVACGFHAGDPSIMRRTCEAAAERGLGVGAHFGFHDLRGFGRRRIDQPPRELRDDIVYQIGALQGVARAAGTTVSYVKTHGALYHCALEREDYAEAILDAVVQAAPEATLMSQPEVSLTRRALERGLTVLREGFVDRTYLGNGLLTPRSRPDALVRDLELAATRAVQIATTGTVSSVEGTVIPMPVDSLCIHSDSPGAVEIASHVRAALERAGVTVAPLA
jgi:UPF0271 protein